MEYRECFAPVTQQREQIAEVNLTVAVNVGWAVGAGPSRRAC